MATSKRTPRPLQLLTEPSPEPIRLLMVEPRTCWAPASARCSTARLTSRSSPRSAPTRPSRRRGCGARRRARQRPRRGRAGERGHAQLRQETPHAAYVVLGGADEDASIAGAIEIRAMGYVAEVAEPAELVETIRRVAQGEDVLKDELDTRPELVDRLLDGFRAAAQAEGPARVP